MLSILVYIAPFVLGVIVLIALLSAIGNFGKARNAPYFRIRRDSTAAGWRAVLLGIVSIAGIIGALQARQSLPPPDLGNLLSPPLSVGPATATFDVNTALSVTPDASGGPTRNPLTSPPTITPTAATPSTLPTAFIATIPSQITPSAGASIQIDSIATGISASLQPVGPGTFFAAGIPRLYVFFTYADMTNGMSWARAVVIDGEVVRSETEAWQRGTNGSAYHYFEAPGGGWPKGAYLIQFYIGDRLAAEAPFTLQ